MCPSGLFLLSPTSDTLLTFSIAGYALRICIRFRSVDTVQGRFTCLTSAPFQAGYYPIQQVMYSLCLSAAGLGFLKHPAPTEDVALPCGLGTDYSDLIGVFLFRIGEMQPGWEPAIPRSRWCVLSDV